MRKIFLTLTLSFCLLLPGAGQVWAQISEDAALAQFTQAGVSYKDGHYAQAVSVYQDIIKGGRESGALYYNLGNSYFKQGLLGKAILHYERAGRLIPRDSDLKANYEYALVLTKGRNGVPGKSFWRKAIDRFIEFYTLDEMILLLLGFSVLAGGSHLLSLYFSWPKRRLAGCLIFSALLFLIYLSGVIIKWQGEENLAIAVTATDSKFEPREGAAIHFKIRRGGKVKILKKMGEWVKIKRPDGKTGWVKKEDLERI